MPRTIDNVGVPLYALGTGLMQAPPEDLPELTRGLPDYAQRDPAELAAMRTRMGVIPQQGRPDITPEHAANLLMLGAGAVAAPEQLAMRGLAALPRAGATGLAALGSYLYGTEQPNAEEKRTPAQIKAEQRILQANGFYPKDKPIDGIEGEATVAARELARQAKEKETSDADAREVERLRLQNESAGNTAKTLEQQNEATRLTQLGEGNERMRQVEANVPPWRKALREYGPPLGYVVGGAVGLGTRAGVYKRATNAAEARAAKAEGLFDDALEGTSKAAQNDRVSRVNSFWRQGGGNEPFNITPNQAPGFASNPNVSPVSSLYGPQRGQAALTNLGANALAGAEMTYAHVQGKDAQAELAASRDAINQSGPTENNIQRLQTAQDNAAWYDFLENAGRGSAIIYNGKAMIKPARNVKPDATAAERERLDLEDILRKPPPAPRTRAQKPAATESPARQAERESRKFNDQGESLGDILTKAAQSMRRDERFLPPDL